MKPSNQQIIINPDSPTPRFQERAAQEFIDEAVRVDNVRRTKVRRDLEDRLDKQRRITEDGL